MELTRALGTAAVEDVEDLPVSTAQQAALDLKETPAGAQAKVDAEAAARIADIDALEAVAVTLSGVQTFTGKKTFQDTSAATVLLAAKVTGDTQDRFSVGIDGKLTWGSGSAGGDTTLQRESAGLLTNPSQAAAGGFRAGATGAGNNNVLLSPLALKHTFGVADTRFWLASNGTSIFGLPAGNDGGGAFYGSGGVGTFISGAGSGSPHFRVFSSFDPTKALMAMDGSGAMVHTVLAAGTVPMALRAHAFQTADLTQWQDSASAVGMAVSAARLLKWPAAFSQATVGAAGAAAALPATPREYIQVTTPSGVGVVPVYAGS